MRGVDIISPWCTLGCVVSLASGSIHPTGHVKYFWCSFEEKLKGLAPKGGKKSFRCYIKIDLA